MFFKKRRDAKKAAAEEARQAIINEFQGRFDAAGKLEDQGEKILKLQDISNDVDAALAQLSGKATKDGVKGQRAFFWTATPAAIAASAVYPPALIGLAGMAASVYGGKKLSKKFGEFAARKQLAKEKPFIDALQNQKTQALNAQDLVANDNPRGVAASPHFGEVLNKVPRLREHFAAAYGNKIAEENAAKKAEPQAKPRWTDDPNPNFKF